MVKVSVIILISVYFENHISPSLLYLTYSLPPLRSSLVVNAHTLFLFSLSFFFTQYSNRHYTFAGGAHHTTSSSSSCSVEVDFLSATTHLVLPATTRIVCNHSPNSPSANCSPNSPSANCA
ncbi:hypothetical protein V8G54_016403, partial [Vigna mungo]